MSAKNIVIVALIVACIYLLFIYHHGIGHYQLAVSGSGVVWVLDTKTGIAKAVVLLSDGKSVAVRILDYRKNSLIMNYQ